MTSRTKPPGSRLVLSLACLLVIAVYAWMIDLKGISTDEGFRMWILNGGKPFVPHETAFDASWPQVLEAISPHAYQPLYYLMQNTLMRVARTQDVLFFRSVNIFFLWVCLEGLIALSRNWRLSPRLFLLGLFSFNAYLFMHVLQIREYIVGLAFYIWSTWLVLRLDARKLDRPWTDVVWFAAYGVLLSLGYFVQSWVVFPAFAQFLFLGVRRRADRLRFFAYVALSYVVVLSLTRPYLEAHKQKVAVGRWGAEGIPLWPQLSDGFHLVLGGHLANRSLFADFLFWFWPAFLAAAAWLFFRRKSPGPPPLEHGEDKRQAFLMMLCIVVSLGFQIGYFLKVDTLSVWPRYFIIHYFFVMWLIALGFKYLHELGSAAAPVGQRRGLAAVTGLVAATLVISACFQIRSYRQDPYLDTGFSRESDWRVLSAELSQIIRPGDVVLTRDFIHRATLTFTKPLPNQVLTMPELEKSDLNSALRVVYLEPTPYTAERTELAARLGSRGFAAPQEIGIRSLSGDGLLRDWRFLTFARQ